MPTRCSGRSSTRTRTRRRVPSPTDVGLAFYTDALYILVSLSEDEADPVTASRKRPGVADRRGRGLRGGARVTARSGAVIALLVGALGGRRGHGDRLLERVPRFRRPSAAADPGGPGGRLRRARRHPAMSRSLARLADGTRDVPGLIRGVRLTFLALAALCAAAGLGAGSSAPADRRARHRGDRRRRDLVPAHRPRVGSRLIRRRPSDSSSLLADEPVLGDLEVDQVGVRPPSGRRY